jgi:hypothetical protein
MAGYKVKHSTWFKVIFNPRFEISMPNNPHWHISKVSTMARNGCQSWTFSANSLGSMLLPSLSGGQQQIGHLVAEM